MQDFLKSTIEIMVKVIAKGKVDGKSTVVTCVEEGGNVIVYQDGKKLRDNDGAKTALFIRSMSRYVKAAETSPCAYNPSPYTIEAYWLSMHETYFDEPPQITIEGEIDCFGSPYSEEVVNDTLF